jgi:hypothetical protein
MNVIDFVKTEYVSVIAGALGGVATAWLTHRVLNKRGTFSYFVNHSRVGLTVEDPIFGKVTALWNGNEIPNLYISSIELTNESMNDYENVVLRTYTSDTRLLSEQTQILDSPNILEWTDKFKQQLHVEPGAQPSTNQWAIFNGQREHLVPVLNRGQSVRLTFLNSANGPNAPTLWVAVSLKGVKVKFRVPQPQVFGVPGPKASLAGVLVGVLVVLGLLQAGLSTWVVGFVALLFGLGAQLPGAYAVRLWRKLYNAIGG